MGRQLNVATFQDPLQHGGLLICGINWGGLPDVSEIPERKSFFSDHSVNSYPYRNRIVRWFGLWGHPLIVRESDAGPFERSIAQTNWLYDQAPNMRSREIVRECVAHPEGLLFHLQYFRPRLVFLVGVSLLVALNEKACMNRVAHFTGAGTNPRWLTKVVIESEKQQRAFRFGFQHFREFEVVALPHPTGSIGLSDAYVAAFAEDISPLLENFKNGLIG